MAESLTREQIAELQARFRDDLLKRIKEIDAGAVITATLGPSGDPKGPVGHEGFSERFYDRFNDNGFFVDQFRKGPDLANDMSIRVQKGGNERVGDRPGGSTTTPVGNQPTGGTTKTQQGK